MIRKFLSGIFSFLTGAVYLVIIVALLVSAPMLLGYRPMTILTGSMEPAYPVGSIVYLKSVDFEDLEVGDAITFRLADSDSVATHRIVEINTEQETFVTKGDANPSNDANPVSYSTVEGRVTRFAIPFIGYLLFHIRNWSIIGAMALILFLNMLLSPSDDKDGATKRSSKENNYFADMPDPAQPAYAAVTAASAQSADQGAQYMSDPSAGSFVPARESLTEADTHSFDSFLAANSVEPSYEASSAKASDFADIYIDKKKETRKKKSSDISAADFFGDL